LQKYLNFFFSVGHPSFEFCKKGWVWQFLACKKLDLMLEVVFPVAEARRSRNFKSISANNIPSLLIMKWNQPFQRSKATDGTFPPRTPFSQSTEYFEVTFSP
jgi:hypothetical protein